MFQKLASYTYSTSIIYGVAAVVCVYSGSFLADSMHRSGSTDARHRGNIETFVKDTLDLCGMKVDMSHFLSFYTGTVCRRVSLDLGAM